MMDAYNSGRFAFYSLIPRTKNPHRPGVEYDRWECGWLDAFDQHTEVLTAKFGREIRPQRKGVPDHGRTRSSEDQALWSAAGRL
jgi:hypothetical protein